MRVPRSLPDCLNPDLRVLFVGINPGLRSAAIGHHFAGYSNRFWKLLFDSELVPIRLTAIEDHRLPEFGFGLTNVVARSSAGIDGLTAADYRTGRRLLLRKIRRYRPRMIALLGITLYPILFQTSGRGRVELGLQPERLAGIRVFLLPNPSGRNAHYSYADMLTHFRGLRDLLRREIQPRGARSCR